MLCGNTYSFLYFFIFIIIPSSCISDIGSIHCKKSWRSSSTPASGDAGPIHTGVEKSFQISDIPEENFTINIELIVYKCRTSSTELEFFKSSTAWARTCNLHIHNPLLYHCATLTLIWGERERAPGRTFTADILPILNCAHIQVWIRLFQHFRKFSLHHLTNRLLLASQ